MLCRYERTVAGVRAQLGRARVHHDQELRVRDVVELRVRHASGRHGRYVQMEWMRRQRPVGRPVRQTVRQAAKPAGDQEDIVIGDGIRRRRFTDGQRKRRRGVPRASGCGDRRPTQLQDWSKGKRDRRERWQSDCAETLVESSRRKRFKLFGTHKMNFLPPPGPY